MEEENKTDIHEESQKHEKTFRETFKSGTPDDVRDKVKHAVEKGVAAVAGALRGFNKETERSDLPSETRGAVHQAAETTKSAASSVSEEAKGLKEPLREAGQKLGETAREIKGSVKEQVEQTRGAVRDAGPAEPTSGSTSSMGLGGSELGREAQGPPRSPTQGVEMPDISRTPMAQSDKKLIGKDLAEDVEE